MQRVLWYPTPYSKRETIGNRRQYVDCGRFNRVVGGVPRTAIETIRDAPELVRRLFSALRQNTLAFAMILRLFFLFVTGLCYLLSPLDILPEGILGIFGLVDDVAVFLILLIIMTAWFRQYLLAVAQNRPR